MKKTLKSWDHKENSLQKLYKHVEDINKMNKSKCLLSHVLCGSGKQKWLNWALRLCLPQGWTAVPSQGSHGYRSACKLTPSRDCWQRSVDEGRWSACLSYSWAVGQRPFPVGSLQVAHSIVAAFQQRKQEKANKTASRDVQPSVTDAWSKWEGGDSEWIKISKLWNHAGEKWNLIGKGEGYSLELCNLRSHQKLFCFQPDIVNLDNDYDDLGLYWCKCSTKR